MSRSSSSSAASPAWPNGGWPMSWPRPIASVRSSFSAQRARDDARDAGRLERVGHPRAVVVARRVDEDLRLALQAAERLRVEDAVAVALERRSDAALAPPARSAAARLVRAHGERRERALLQLADARGEGVGNPPGDLGHRGHGSRCGRQMMIGTVPPSADQAAPVTYEARVGAGGTRSRGDLLGLGQPPQRPAGADLREHLVAVALLLREPARRRATPRSRSARA